MRRDNSNSSRRPKSQEIVRQIYRRLAKRWGAQHWWPADTPFEVITGAILTQNTSWKNVERALANLRGANVLRVDGIRRLGMEELQQLIRCSGYYRQKSERLKNFVSFLDAKHNGSLDAMFAKSTEELRAELLTQKGIGPETADAILLYAGQHEVFVVDAYTNRVLQRHEAIAPGAKYEAVRALVESALRDEAIQKEGHKDSVTCPPVHQRTTMSLAIRSQRAAVYNEMHGLLVQVGKRYCYKVEPKCDECPLGAMLGRAARRRLASESPSTR